MTRCGIGYDVHRLAKGRKLILGGVEIAHSHGLEGHSDADVLSHAIADALLGAIGAGDIGQHFPNTDESIRGISSIEILKRVTELLTDKRARVLNVDATHRRNAENHSSRSRDAPKNCDCHRHKRIECEREGYYQRKARSSRAERRDGCNCDCNY